MHAKHLADGTQCKLKSSNPQTYKREAENTNPVKL